MSKMKYFDGTVWQVVGTDASKVGIVDSGGKFTTTNVEDALSEIVSEIDTHLSDYVRQSGYGITAGSANTYTLTLSPSLTAYTAGVGITVKINVANTGASTININGLGAKSILDSKGNAIISGKLRLNGVYTLRYDGTNFILQGEGGEYGSATAADVLVTDTLGTETGIVQGTMPNIGSVGTPNLVSQNQEYTIVAGYHNGLGKVKAVITGLVASVIKAGTTVGGILGTFTADGTATASHILLNMKAYVNGSLVTGTIPSKTAATYTPSASIQTIAANQFLSGVQTISAVAVPVANVLTGTTIAGQAGTMPNNASPTSTLQIVGSAKPTKVVAAGYNPGGTITAELAAALAPSIASGVNIGGVVGTNTNKKYATGTATLAGNFANISGLSFMPGVVIVYTPNMYFWYRGGVYFRSYLIGSGNAYDGCAYTSSSFSINTGEYGNSYTWWAWEM